MRIVILEGTVEEISQTISLVPAFPSTKVFSMQEETTVEPPPVERSQEQTEKITPVELWVRVLTRRPPLSEPLKKALCALEPAHPEWLSSKDLQMTTGYQPAQLAGMLGALGRRVSKTEGYEKGAEFFETSWSEELGSWEYRLTESSLEALRLVGLT